MHSASGLLLGCSQVDINLFIELLLYPPRYGLYYTSVWYLSCHDKKFLSTLGLSGEKRGNEWGCCIYKSNFLIKVHALTCRSIEVLDIHLFVIALLTALGEDWLPDCQCTRVDQEGLANGTVPYMLPIVWGNNIFDCVGYVVPQSSDKYVGVAVRHSLGQVGRWIHRVSCEVWIN